MERSVAAASAYREVVDVALAVVEPGKGLHRVAEGGMGGHVGYHFTTDIDLAPVPNRLESIRLPSSALRLPHVRMLRQRARLSHHTCRQELLTGLFLLTCLD